MSIPYLLQPYKHLEFTQTLRGQQFVLVLGKPHIRRVDSGRRMRYNLL